MLASLPLGKRKRLLVMLLSFVAVFGPYYCFDLPASTLTGVGLGAAPRDAPSPFPRRLTTVYVSCSPVEDPHGRTVVHH